MLSRLVSSRLASSLIRFVNMWNGEKRDYKQDQTPDSKIQFFTFD